MWTSEPWKSAERTCSPCLTAPPAVRSNPRSRSIAEPHRASQLYRRSPFCLLFWDGDTLVARDANGVRAFRGADRYLAILQRLGRWFTAQELAEDLGLEAESTRRALERLMAMQLVVSVGPDEEESEIGLDHGWDIVELALQRQTATGGANPRSGANDDPPAAFKPVPDSLRYELRRRPLENGPSFRSVLETRRSVRRYADEELTFEELETFLHSTAQVRPPRSGSSRPDVSSRPSPSGGARHPLELYPVCNAVAGVAPGAYYFHPREHTLYLVRTCDDGQAELNRQVHAATGHALNLDPPVILVVTAVFQRTTWKYGRLGLPLILNDLGALYQTMYLVATAMGLAPCAVAGGDEAANARWLGLDPMAESQVGSFLLGHCP